MKKRIWKLCIAGLISLIALGAIRATVSACSGGWETDNDYFSLFSSDIMGPTRLSPFFYTRSTVYYQSGLDSLLGRDTTDQYLSNTEEWRTYMQHEAQAGDVNVFIYKSKPTELEMLRHWLRNEPFSLSDSLKKNEAFLYLKKKNDQEALNYMLFAKRCEPQVTAVYEDGWAAPPVRDTLLMKKLMTEGQQAYAAAKSDFIRSRYAFQVIRLAHYSGQYEACLDLYEKMMAGKNEGSVVALWSIALKGGALTRLKRGDEAAYLFAMLFDKHFNFNWELYKRNFDWAQGKGLRFCKNDHEKTVVTALAALSSGDLLPTLKEMYEQEPGSDYLDLMLTRHIRQVELNALPGKFHWGQPGDLQLQVKAGNVEETKAFVNSTLKKGGLKRPWLWEYVAGYLAYLTKDQPGTTSHFLSASMRGRGNVLLKEHMDVILILQKIDMTPLIDKAFENSIYADALHLQDKSVAGVHDARSFFFRKLATRYLQQGDTLRYLMSESQSPEVPDLRASPDEFDLNKVIAFMARPDLSPFEKLLSKGFGDFYTVESLHEIMGTSFLGAFEFSHAVSEFEQAGKTVHVLLADPFLIHIKDCHDCDYERAGNGMKMTKLDLARELVALEKEANTPSEQQAAACYKLGNACYNLTDFGNNWSATRYYWSPPYYVAWVRDKPDTTYDDCFKALGYYNKALTLTKDKELAARCCFMASKCEQNMFYTSNDYGVDALGDARKNAKYRTYFKILKAKYADTKFYNEAIGECGYLKSYAVKK
jgi:hypothetical protein